jgi:hypothetical protein
MRAAVVVCASSDDQAHSHVLHSHVIAGPFLEIVTPATRTPQVRPGHPHHEPPLSVTTSHLVGEPFPLAALGRGVG